ncbi:MAG: SLBB domain-containing protein [Candidatus Zixiibacteriota bacterium]|nr:MAG: SLBB domain-containing protein [candidate division Zixibacteria bacterium]
MILRSRKRPGGGSFCVTVILAVLLWWIVLFSYPPMTAAQETGFGTVVDPDEYIVRPGDKFRIDFWDGASPTINVEVTPEGSILITAMGKIEVANLSLAAAKARLDDLIKKYYPDTEFSVSLEGIRSAKILVIGGVQNPGLYEGFVSQQVSEFIVKAGGLVPGASSRNIILNCRGRDDIVVDLLEFERLGKMSANPRIYAGDVIRVPLVTDSSMFVHISGAVIRPGDFEYRGGDILGTILDLALGLNGLEGDSVYIYRSVGPGTRPFHVSVTNRGFPIEAADKIIVPLRCPGIPPNFFAITGEIAVPGRYPYQDDLNLEAALRLAGGETEQSDIYSLVIYRRAEYHRPQEAQRLIAPSDRNNISLAGERVPVSLDVAGIRPGGFASVAIAPGDSIVVPQKTGSVSIFGHVRRPGVIDFERPLPIRALVKKVGGYAPGADKKRAQVIRKASGAIITPGTNMLVFDGDVIIIPEDKNKKGFWTRIRDLSLFLGGLGVVYLAVDNAAD